MIVFSNCSGFDLSKYDFSAFVYCLYEVEDKKVFVKETLKTVQ